MSASLKKAFAAHQKQRAQKRRSGGGFSARQGRLAIVNDPALRTPAGSLCLYVPAAMRRLEDLAWAVTAKLRPSTR